MPIARSGEVTTVKVPGPLVQRVDIRAGDDLPGFAAIVEDDLGNPVNLTASKCYFCLDDGNGNWHVKAQCYISNAAAGVVTFDWSAIMTADEWGVGTHPLAILVHYDDGREFTAPSDKGSVTLLVRPGVPPVISPM
jgi:hypothetical protein